MTPEARAMLDQIDQFLRRNDTASAELAAVLTALRSDDQGNATSKATITIPIRRAAFPLCAKSYDANHVAISLGHDTDREFGLRSSRMEGQPLPFTVSRYRADHFEIHARLAAEVLGLPIAEPPSKDGW